MTDGLDILTGGGQTPPPSGGGRRRAAVKAKKPWARIIVIIILLAGLLVGGKFAWDKASNFLNGPADYTGQGTGEAIVEIPEGANGQQIANILFEADVVKSAEAFYQLALKDPRAATIEPGFYKLRQEMSAEWALRELSDKANRVEGKVTIIEGARIGQIVKVITENTEIPEEDLTAVLDNPESLGLPESANGNPEGYLFPATYTVRPGTTAEQLLKQMVDKTLQVAEDLDIANRAKALGLTYEEVITMASILEYEANGSEEDRKKVARVFYNRLEQGMAFQSDATVTYISGREGDVWTTPEERADPSLYNTYQHVGLPPGPIGSPGAAAIEAALNPADGPWLYFVPIDLETGNTAFAATYAEHLRNVEKFKEYCRGTDKC